MSFNLPYGIIDQIIDTVGEGKDTNLLKELSLVSHSFHQICCKHLFASVELHDADPKHHIASSKKGFVKLLKRRPHIVEYIRNLKYEVSDNNNDDRRLLHILPKLLQTISCLNCLTIVGSRMHWDTLDSALTSALLYLMHLPTINHIDLSIIRNFPPASLTPSVNLLRLDINDVEPPKEIVVQLEMMPRIREFRTSNSTWMTRRLLRVKTQDGQPAFNLTDLRRLSICLGDEQNIRCLLQNSKLLEELHLSTSELYQDQRLDGLHDILSASAGTLKVLGLRIILFEFYDGSTDQVFEGLCRELEAMAGDDNKLEALSLEVKVVRDQTPDYIGSMIQNLEKVLVKPGWSSLRQVSIKVPVACCLEIEEISGTGKVEELKSLLPDKFLSQLSKLESVSLNFSSYTVCVCYTKPFCPHV